MNPEESIGQSQLTLTTPKDMDRMSPITCVSNQRYSNPTLNIKLINELTCFYFDHV